MMLSCEHLLFFCSAGGAGWWKSGPALAATPPFNQHVPRPDTRAAQHFCTFLLPDPGEPENAVSSRSPQASSWTLEWTRCDSLKLSQTSKSQG